MYQYQEYRYLGLDHTHESYLYHVRVHVKGEDQPQYFVQRPAVSERAVSTLRYARCSPVDMYIAPSVGTARLEHGEPLFESPRAAPAKAKAQ